MKSVYLPKGLLEYKIRKLFKEQASKQFSSEDVIRILNLENTPDQVENCLQRFVKHGFLSTGKPGKYVITRQERSKKKPKYFEGTVDMTRTGSAYILCDALPFDVHIPRKYMANALDGDTVRFEHFYSGKSRSKHDGKIIEVIKRANSQFMGVVNKYKSYATVFVDRAKNEFEIFIDLKNAKDVKTRDKVVVEITEWRGEQKSIPWGKIVQSFGQDESSDMEMNAILVNNGFKIEFPGEVISEAAVLTGEILGEEVAKRRDFRDVFTITIDPFNARDFDDALSLKHLDNGHLEIGVHIADVTHFVKPGTALDKEAFERSTSVYLVDRVCPMLPEKLSNELCSLRPNEDKYCFSAVFEFDQKFNIQSEWFGKTIIHSDRRFTYEEVQEILDQGHGEFYEQLELLNRVAKKMREEKMQNGAIAFESEEVEFELDSDGSIIGVHPKIRKDAHMLVEDFMLLANKKVAWYISKRPGALVPFVYRVHDLPDPDKLTDFAEFAREMGVSIFLDTPKQIAASFNQLNELAQQNEALKILEPMALRTMAKAVYSTENIGHYGLSFSHYAHFTSPIRRYADVLVHRILQDNLGGEKRLDKAKLEAQCLHISSQERKATEAERASVKYKQVEFIFGHIGEEFDGYISGFIERGFFVILSESRVEGLVGFDSLDEDYSLDPSKLKARGRHSGIIRKMGDQVRVRIVDADLDRRLVDMELVE
ncbi:MAG TPA: ribonuclease R [Saprospiraceae bacterium]|nr:ribonuclease R [Saprospirales bacterium]HRQ29819.1 ribonuclease R [Saprospiraceae bacterium]